MRRQQIGNLEGKGKMGNWKEMERKGRGLDSDL